MVIPGWVEAALAKAASTPEHQQDMEALSGHLFIGDALDIQGRMDARRIRATEEAGRLYQEALDAWNARHGWPTTLGS